jgi:hypothetical protein
LGQIGLFSVLFSESQFHPNHLGTPLYAHTPLGFGDGKCWPSIVTDTVMTDVFARCDGNL